MLFIHFIAVGKRNEQRLRQRLIRTTSAPEVVAITPDDSVDIRHTFASADTPPDTIPVLPDIVVDVPSIKLVLHDVKAFERRVGPISRV